MLCDLHIKDMLLIDQLSLGFKPGLNVLTGETGAGKSILLDSLGFVLGWRGRADMVRAGAAQGSVQASFELSPNHPARAVLDEAGIHLEDDVLMLRRTNSPDGRKTAYVNDQRCSGELLRRLSDCLIELHGQNDDRGLVNPRGHRALLDSYAGIDLAPLRGAWAARQKAAKELQEAREALALAKQEEEFLSHSVKELSDFAPQEGEDEKLDQARRLMQSAEKIREDVGRAHTTLSENADGAIADALRWLSDASAQVDGQLETALDTLGRAASELADAQSQIEACISALDFDPIALEQAEERLFALRALARKHNVQPDALPALHQKMARDFDQISNSEEHLAALEVNLQKVSAAYDATANKISRARSEAARSLDKAIMAELGPLKMDAARFETHITTIDPGPEGVDEVVFLIAPNPGAPAGPLGKIASGGELSRFLLAMKVCLTHGAEDLTLIFDEIDRGVGGATAAAVGARLAELAQEGQVLVVTHSPQVAAKGAHHWKVSKHVFEGVTHSRVTPLDGAAKLDEVARMLSGDEITDAARGAAQSLIFES